MMNNINKKVSMISLIVLVVAMCIYSCKKSDYLTDGGLASAKTSYSTYDYLAANEYHYFDTLLLIVDHLGLKDSLNKSGSFFAPTDYAINRIMQTLGVNSLNDFYSHITSKFLTQYMFSDTSMTLSNASTTAKVYTNWADTIAGLKKVAGSYYVANSSLTYYTLEYIKINGYLDGSANAPANDPSDLILPCQTTGIKTSTGTNLNALSNAAVLTAK